MMHENLNEVFGRTNARHIGCAAQFTRSCKGHVMRSQRRRDGCRVWVAEFLAHIRCASDDCPAQDTTAGLGTTLPSASEVWPG